MDQQRLKTIIEKVLAGNVTAEEAAEISKAIQATPGDQVVEDIHAMLSGPEYEQFLYDEKKWDVISDKILNADNIKEEFNYGPKVISLAAKLSIAAAVFFVLASGIYFLTSNNNNNVIAKIPDAPVLNDVSAPKHTNAVLTLSNGKKVELDSAGVGSLAVEGNADVIKLANGEIVYDPGSAMLEKETRYNTLTVPRGSKVVSVTMADGTKVWLNNESSLRYPAAFTGSERKVEITGEAYFEVAKIDKMPFIVTSRETSIKVLGTHFNVNAYNEETFLKVTLLEGSVNVSKAASSIILHPGEQAQVNENIKLNTGCNMEEVMAWKNGKFVFYEADIKTIMDQLARWYDLNVVVIGESKEKFHVEIIRNTDLSNVFKILEGTGGVHFKFEGNKIIVMPKQ